MRGGDRMQCDGWCKARMAATPLQRQLLFCGEMSEPEAWRHSWRWPGHAVCRLDILTKLAGYNQNVEATKAEVDVRGFQLTKIPQPGTWRHTLAILWPWDSQNLPKGSSRLPQPGTLEAYFGNMGILWL